MYSDDPNVAKAQKIMLEILLVVHKICEENDIKYFLDGGTMLGAIRHKGFIPWDDDIDIAMSRPEYEKFCKIVPEKLPPGFFFQDHNTDPKYKRTFAKIRKEGTMLIEKHESGNEDFSHGIYIDVFPFDYYDSNTFIYIMGLTKKLRQKRNKMPRGLKRSIYTFFSHWLLGIPHLLTLGIRRILYKYPRLYGSEKSVYMGHLLYSIFPLRDTRAGDFYPTKYVENCFEGHGFYLPNNPDAILTSYYGDYMTIPPEHERQTHAKTIVVDVASEDIEKY